MPTDNEGNNRSILGSLFGRRRRRRRPTPPEKNSSTRTADCTDSKPSTSRRRWSLHSSFSRPNLVRLLDRGEWDRIRSILTPSDDPLLEILPLKAMEECTDFTGQTALHVALKCEAPLDLMELMVDAMPLCPHTVDCLGQAPLHVAAAWGASPETVAFLVACAPTVALSRDCNGQTPLHLACQSLGTPRVMEKFSSSRKEQRWSVRVLSLLLQAHAGAVHLEDNSGRTPLDYAVEAEDDIEMTIVEMLEEAATLVHKPKLTSATGKKPDYQVTLFEEQLLAERLTKHLGVTLDDNSGEYCSKGGAASSKMTVGMPSDIEFSVGWADEDDDAISIMSEK